MTSKPKLPLIGISASTSTISDCDQAAPPLERDAILRLYSEAVVMAGGLPLVLPLVRRPLAGGEGEGVLSLCGPGSLNHNAEIYMEHLDGLLLSGGGDVVLGMPSIPDAYTNVDKNRDFWEVALLAAAMKSAKPVLGVCRGIQLMNIALGGSIWGDIPSMLPQALEHKQKEPRARTSHEVSVTPDSRLYKICGREKFMVNSIHHQSVKDLASGFKAVAWSSDGLIEALEGEGEAFVLGVQWHPEALLPRSQESLKLFSAFVAEAARGAGR